VLCVGVGVGAITSYQLFDIRLTEGSGDLLGAALGAFLAVSFASWLDGRRLTTERNAMKVAIVGVLTPFMDVTSGQLIAALTAYNGGMGRWDDVRASAANSVESLDRALSDLGAIKPAFEKNAIDLLIHAQLSDALNKLREEVKHIHRAFSPTVDWIPPSQGAHDPLALRPFLNHVWSVVAPLDKEF
jgi:hypothetical protein